MSDVVTILKQKQAELSDELGRVEKALAALTGTARRRARVPKVAGAKRKRRGRKFTAAQRKAQGERMKKIWIERRKKEKKSAE